MVTPFVGRREELDQLAELMRRSRKERAPSAALVTGEPGSGKSRLLAEVLDRAEVTRQSRVVGFEPVQSIPLAAVGALLRQLAQVPGPGPDLGRLVFGEDGQESRDPLRIFEGTHRALASSGPMLIAIDDLQWVDDLSLGLIHYLLQAAAATHHGLMVIAMARPAPITASFGASIDAIIPSGQRAHIELRPLALEDGLSLAHALNANLNDAAAADLWRRAGGSPFWLHSLALGSTKGDLSNVIQDRLRDLSTDAAALLTALAIGGRPFALDDLGRVLEWEARRLDDAAGELTRRGLVVVAAGMLRTAHDLIREAARPGAPSARSRRLHAGFADLIEQDAGSDLQLLLEALEHRVVAGSPTTSLGLRMVTSPQRRLLGSDGLSTLASIADGVGPGSAEQIAFDEALGELAGVLGEEQLAIERWSRVAEVIDDPARRRHAELEAARAAYLAGLRAQAHAHLGRARGIGGATLEIAVRMDTLEADIQLWLDHETAAGSRAADRALDAAREMAVTAGGIERLSAGERATYAAALDTAIDAAMQEDRGDDVIRLSETGLLLASKLDEESSVAAMLRLGIALLPFGRMREAGTILRDVWDVARRRVMPTAMVEAGNGLARALLSLGRFTEAQTVAAEAAQLDQRLGNAPRRWGNPTPWLHAIELSLGDSASAVQALRRDAVLEVDPHFRMRIHQNIASWQARCGGGGMAREVEAELAAARADSALARCPRCASELAVTSAELLARIGRVEEARQEMDAWESHAIPPGYLMREVRRARSRSAISAASGDVQAAVSILEVLSEDLEREGLLEDLLWAHLDLGRVLAQVDRDGSVRAFTRAAALAEDLGAKTQQRVAAQELRRLGVRAWRRGPEARGKGVAGLSPREIEVARRVAGGASNREVAGSLLISPRTVERHVTNVLAKLNLRNRTELATFIRSTPVVRASTDDGGSAEA
jgi:DNA-binding CsgD family transcriptional regulator